MDIQPQVKLKLKGIEITDVQFTSITPIAQSGEKLDLTIKSKVIYSTEEVKRFKIVIRVNISSPEHYTLQVEGAGSFLLDGEVTEESKKLFVNTNAPAIVFPYIRAFIATISANLGSTGLITIPPHFFKGAITEELK